MIQLYIDIGSFVAGALIGMGICDYFGLYLNDLDRLIRSPVFNTKNAKYWLHVFIIEPVFYGIIWPYYVYCYANIMWRYIKDPDDMLTKTFYILERRMSYRKEF